MSEGTLGLLWHPEDPGALQVLCGTLGTQGHFKAFVAPLGPRGTSGPICFMCRLSEWWITVTTRHVLQLNILLGLQLYFSANCSVECLIKKNVQYPRCSYFCPSLVLRWSVSALLYFKKSQRNYSELIRCFKTREASLCLPGMCACDGRLGALLPPLLPLVVRQAGVGVAPMAAIDSRETAW